MPTPEGDCLPQLRKQHVGVAVPGGRLSYVVQWSNPCRTDIPGVTVWDDLPDGASLLRVTSAVPVSIVGNRVVFDIGNLARGPAGFATIDVSLDQNLPPASPLRNLAFLRDAWGRTVEEEDVALVRPAGSGRIACAFRAQVYARPGGPIRYVVRYKNAGTNNVVTLSLPSEFVQTLAYSQAPDVATGTVAQFRRLARTAGSIKVDTRVDPAAPDGARLYSWASIEDEAGNVALCEHQSQVRRFDRLALFFKGNSKSRPGLVAQYTARYMNASGQNELRIVVPPELEVVSSYPAVSRVEGATWIFRNLPAPNGVVKLRARVRPEVPAGTVIAIAASMTDESGEVRSSTTQTEVGR